MPAKRPTRLRKGDSIAARLHSERIASRFSQEELATEIGCTRSALANYEVERSPIPFNIGLAACRRLDIFPRYLATGEEPRSPFIEPQELGISVAEIAGACERGDTFESAYIRLFLGPIAKWIEKNPPEKMVMRQLAGGPEKAARLMSLEDLKASVVEAAVQVKTAPDHLARGYAAILAAYAAELSARLEIR